MRFVSLSIVMLVTGCAQDVVGPMPRAEPFIALTDDFVRFADWPHVQVEPFTGAGGHRVGPTRVFLDGVVPEEGQDFAVGTILVKTVEEGDPEEWEIHGMVKRGGGYNSLGALGWEYFDLALTPDASPVIAWRGAGDAGDPGSYFTSDGERIACNDCHVLAGSRNNVFSLPALRELL